MKRELLDFCVNVNEFYEFCVTSENPNILRECILQSGIGDPRVSRAFINVYMIELIT